MTTFRNLNVYIKSKELVKQIYSLLKKFPREEQFALSDQLRRAVISIPSNIAEGSGRNSQKTKRISITSPMALYWRCSLSWILHATLGILVKRSLINWNH